jgi:hypothetical protein
MTKFFAAANTEQGFVSLFSEYFSPEAHRRIYILKGGPGTGKSTLMRGIGEIAEKSGYETEYIHCSSDTDSLDGVRIPALGVAVLDGTAPHITEAQYPGVIEQIVNLGEAFDVEGLHAEREIILSLSREKKEAYCTAYRFLSAAGRVAREMDDLLAPVFLSAKAEAAAQRLVSSLKKAEKGGETHRYISAIGVHGCVKLDTLTQRARKLFAVTGKHGLPYLFMNHLHAALSRTKIRMTVCGTPLVGTHTEAIYVEGEDILFLVMEEQEAQKADKVINCSRFASHDRLSARRARLRFAEKCEESLLSGALDALAEAGGIHSKLEDIYGKYMDFGAVDRMKNRMISEIFANNI